jgi:hypothetical protein
MSLDRIVLALNGAFCLFAGVACVVAPASLAQQAGLSMVPSALTEIRAFHGGLLVGIGCFQIWCMQRPASTFAGLLMVVFSVGGAGIARVLGMLVDQEPTAYHLTNLAVEAITVSVVTFALSRQRLGDASA